LEFKLNLYFHWSCPVVKNICFVRCYDSKGWKEDGKSTPDFVEEIDCTTLGGGDNGSPEESKESTVAGEPVETEDPDPTDEATEEPEPTEEPDPEPTEEPEETEEPEPEPTEDTNSSEPTEEPEETEEPNTSNEATEEPLEPATNNAATEEPDEIVTDGSETPTQNANINPQEPEPVTNPVNNPVVDPEEEVSGKYRA